MIIIDFNQVALSNLMMQIGNHTNMQIEENMVRHMILNSIRSYKQKFGSEFGEIVIACDNTNCWRKKVFPYYKANRKKTIEASELDWKLIFECLNKIRSELKIFFPYRIIDIETAEADDVIGSLVQNYEDLDDPVNKILILSGDKDFIQLQVYDNVQQYDPVRKKWIEHPDPKMFLREHVIRGDFGDGIPNVLSNDNCLVIGERQKAITKGRLAKLLEGSSDTVISKNIGRNEILIDLSYTPRRIQDEVIDSYKDQDDRDRSKLLNYFISNRLKNLTEHISEF